ncbi:MAG TPA: neutral zinc metallopeptidase [Kofleriaceae bacterium]
MQWDRNYSSSDIEDRRGENGAGLGGFGLGGGGGGGAFLLIRLLSMFGWKGILVGLVIAGAVMFGGQCTHLGGSQAPAPQNQSSPATSSHSPVQQSPEEAEEVHFVGFVFDDIQKSWAKQIPDYRKAHLVLFRRGIRSACGTASTAVGPFYCQLDQKVYIDLAFYDELKNRLGAPGDFAQAYVIAHEVGHHIQKLKGLFDRGTGSVQIELQADCFAGAWAKDANDRKILDPGDIDEALHAASQIGDDTLQKQAQGYVQPEKFTHGSSAQRVAALRKGWDGGAQACMQ